MLSHIPSNKLDTFPIFTLDCLDATNYNLVLEQSFGYGIAKGGTELMTKNEYELMYLIRTNENPQKALLTAIDIICQYITQHLSSPEQSAADPPVSA